MTRHGLVLGGRSISLRPFAEADADDVLAYAADAEVTRYLTWHPHKSLSDSLAFIRSVQGEDTDRAMTWAIVWRGEGRVIGSTGFIRIEKQHATAEVGTAISRRFWGTGANTEAKLLLFSYGFTQLGLQRIEMRTDTRNLRSQGAIEKMGLTREGVLRRYPRVKGEERDTVIYSLLRQEWQADPRFHSAV